jgi:transcriptional regulator with XRE-family HTH domain
MLALMANANAQYTRETGGIRSQRRHAGLTQQQLAEIVGCSMSYVRLLEAGFTPSEGEVLPRIERALAVLDATNANAPSDHLEASPISGGLSRRDES